MDKIYYFLLDFGVTSCFKKHAAVANNVSQKWKSSVSFLINPEILLEDILEKSIFSKRFVKEGHCGAGFVKNMESHQQH